MTIFNDSIERVQDRLTVAAQVLVTAYADLRVRGYDKEPSAIAATLADMEALVESLRAANFGAEGVLEVGQADLVVEANAFAEHACNCPFCSHGLPELPATPEPSTRVFRRETGWVMAGEPAECTTNYRREQEGRPACTATAVWKVVEDRGMHLTIGFYCDADLPDEHRPAQPEAA
jgi:hypothetical protein